MQRGGIGAQRAEFDLGLERNQSGSTLLESMMPTTITLKGIPANVYQQLKRSAEDNRCSLNNEAIACLETLVVAEEGHRALARREGP